MFYFAQIPDGKGDPSFLVGVLAITALGCYAGWLCFNWLKKIPLTPDPWDNQVAADIARDDAIPLCHSCLSPHSAATDFCPECGAAVGQYTNWLPYPQLFSIGHVLRIGTFGNFKRSPVTVAGFWFFGLAEYTLFAPIYWFMLWRNEVQKHQVASPPDHPSEETGQRV